MSNHITIEWCTEDRARIDRLIEALEALKPTVLQKAEPEQLTIDPALLEPTTHGEAPKTPVNEAKAAPAQTADPVEETATEEADAPAAEAKPTITQEQLQQKVTQLAAANNGALKTKVREIVTAYAKKVSDIPEDKRAEVWDKLTALEA